MDLARIFHSHLGKGREKPYEKRGAKTSKGVVKTTRHAGLKTSVPKGSGLAKQQAGKPALRRWNAAVSAERIVARLQRLMATVAANPGRCPGLSCGGLSGLGFAPPFWKKEAMDLPLTERLRCCDTAGWETCATTIGRAHPKIAVPGQAGPRAEARVGAVDEASTAAREGACAPRDQPRQRMAVARFHWK